MNDASGDPLNQSLDDALVDLLYRWNRTEKPLGFSVIDIDILQQGDRHPGVFTDRAEITAAISSLEERIDPASAPYTAAKVRACAAFVRALDGERLPFPIYVRQTLGVTPQMIPERALQDQFDHNTALLGGLGYPHTCDGVERWRHDNLLDRDAIRESFANAEHALVPLVKAAAGVDIDVEYRVEVIDVDAYWMNWTGTDDAGNVVLQFNTNSRHTWCAGGPEWLALHEIGGHALQLTAWKHQLRQGKLPRSAGVITNFTSDMFLMEGLAETLSAFCPELPLTNVGRWSIAMSWLERMVWNNAQIMANDGAGCKDVLTFVDRWCPAYATEASRTSEYDECLNHPLLRAYLLAYGSSSTVHRQLAARLSPDERRAYLARVYAGPMEPDEIPAWSGEVATPVRSQ